jgi:catechol 2,3-dioxygenase-like lactoylglutathione lyase family enzyme
MGAVMKPRFGPGANIAIKVPPHQFEQTVAFYRDILGLEQLGPGPQAQPGSIRFGFGDKQLWIDRTPSIGRAEIWLEIQTDDADQAAAYLERHNIARCDAVEPLPAGFKGFWVSSPAQIVHLIDEQKSITGNNPAQVSKAP